MAVEVEEIPSGNSENKKRKISSSVLDHFTLLTSNSEQTRIDRGAKLLSYLFSNEDKEESEKELSYALKRLLRGISSSRACAREGYFTVLSVFLNQNKDVTITYIVEQLENELKSGGQSKSEVGEVCAGVVLSCGAVLRSGLFSRSSQDERILLITTLMNAATKKTYLGLAAYSFIVDYINTNSEEDVTEKLWPLIKSHLSVPLSEHTLDSLYCLMVTMGKYPSLTKKIIKKKMGYSSLLCEETLPIICDKIMNTPEFASVHHPVYKIFGVELTKSDVLVDFWMRGLEPKMNLKNPNRIIISLNVLISIFSNLPDTCVIPDLLTKKFLTNLLDWFKSFNATGKNIRMKKIRGKKRQDDEDDRCKEVILKARDFFDVLMEIIKSDKTTKATVHNIAQKLLFDPGDIMIGEITNSKIVKTLMDELDFEHIKALADVLKDIVTNTSKKINPLDGSQRHWVNAERLRAAEMLTYLINHRLSLENVKWRIKKMQALLKICLFKCNEEGSPISVELSSALKKCFFRCLTNNLPKLDTLLKVLTSIVDHVDNIVSDEVNLRNLSKPLSNEALESWKNMMNFNMKLEHSAKKSKASSVFKILSLHTGLFLFSDVMSEKAAIDSLQEVQNCYEHFMANDKPMNKSVKEMKEGDVVEEEPEWIEVLVDVFLNFLSRESLLLRNVVQCVFRLLCEYLTPSAIGQMISVLDPDSDTNPLEKHGEHSDESDTEAEDANDDDEKDKSEEEDASSESDAEDGDGAEESATATDQLRMAIQKALGSAAPETDTESVDVDDIDEEEGKKIDKALSDAFRMLKQSRGKKSKKDKKNEKSLMDFRMRVVDLIDIYLEKEPSMELCLGMLAPLSRCLEYSIKEADQQPLENKLRKCIRCLTNVKNFSSCEGVTVELLGDYLRAVMNRGTRTQFVFQALGDVVSKCSSFIIRCLQKIKSPQTPSGKKKKRKQCPIVEIYQDSLATFFSKRDCLLPVILFHEILLVSWEGKWHVLPVIIEHAFSEEVRPYRRNEGLEMLNLFYKNLKRSLQQEKASDISGKLEPIEHSISEKAIEVLGNKTIVNERYFTILMKLFSTIKSYHASVSGSTDNMNWNEITSLIQDCRRGLKLKTSSDYQRVCNLFGLEKLNNVHIPTDKESTDSGHDSDIDDGKKEADEMKSNKCKRSVNGLDNKKPAKRVKKEVSKKESKMLRAQASGVGLEDISFSKFLESNVDVDEKPVIQENEDKLKKKRMADDEPTTKKLKKSRKV